MPHAIPHDEMIAAEETLIADAQFVIHNLMTDAGLSRADLARSLGVSDARVTQMFADGAKNLTLRTLARVFRVLDQECRITCARWENILTSAREGEGSATAPLSEGAAFDFASMLEAIDHLERASCEGYSNDNSLADALAA